MLREVLMLVIPRLADNFPLDILVANLVVSFVTGSRHGALPSACRVRWDQPIGWDRHCWRIVDVFEFCLRDGRVDVRFGGKLSSCLRLRLD